MSYYALPYPLTAVAKDAGGSKWGRGLEYLWDLLAPYVLLVPLGAVLIAGLVCLWAVANPLPRLRSRSSRTAGRSAGGAEAEQGGDDGGDAAGGDTDDDDDAVSRLRRLRGRVRSTPVVTVVFLVVAVVMLLYVTRVGGDFMHGRVLLPSLFLLLLPVS